jgi:hypothetical protein
VGREAANRVAINCWYQRRCGAVGADSYQRVRTDAGRVWVQPFPRRASPAAPAPEAPWPPHPPAPLAMRVPPPPTAPPPRPIRLPPRSPPVRLNPHPPQPGLLGSFLWYRPGLCHCRFGYAIKDLYGAKIARFPPAQAGFTAGQSRFTAVPGWQNNCFPSALRRTWGGLARRLTPSPCIGDGLPRSSPLLSLLGARPGFGCRRHRCLHPPPRRRHARRRRLHHAHHPGRGCLSHLRPHPRRLPHRFVHSHSYSSTRHLPHLVVETIVWWATRSSSWVWARWPARWAAWGCSGSTVARTRSTCT